MGKEINLKNRKSVSVYLKDWCLMSMGGENSDYMEVTEWSNGEGYDIYISRKLSNDTYTDENFDLTYGQFKALKRMIKIIEKSYN